MTTVKSLLQGATPLSKALSHVSDVIGPHVRSSSPGRIEFIVGAQINGVPHLGTHLVQTAAFLLAQQAREDFGTPVTVRFHFLDHAAHERVRDGRTGRVYQRSCFHALGSDGVTERVEGHYRPLFDALMRATGVDYVTDTYSALQSRSAFRAEFLRTLAMMDSLRWWLAPSSGAVPIGVPCPSCGWAEEDAGQTCLVHRDEGCAVFEALCHRHGVYEERVEPAGGGYLGLADLHRNVVKERVACQDTTTLRVMVKGVDWAPACSLVDRAHSLLGTVGTLPARVFTPLVLFDSGAQFSKSLIRRSGGPGAFPGVAPWMLAASEWPGSTDQYAHLLTRLTSQLVSTPDRFARSYTATELAHLTTSTSPAASRQIAWRP